MQWPERRALLNPQSSTWLQVKVQTASWALVVTWATDISMDSDCVGTTDHGPQQLHGTQDSAWPQTAIHAVHISTPHPRQQSLRSSLRHQSEVQTAYVHTDLRLHHGLRLQHEPQTPTWPPVASQTTGVFELECSVSPRIFLQTL